MRSMVVWLACVGCAASEVRVRSERLVAAASTRAPAREAPSGPWRITRAAVTDAVVAHDPGREARVERAREAVATAAAEGAMPAPELGAQVWNLPAARPWSFGDADMYMVELRQRIPAPGSLGARERAMASEAAMALAEVSMRERELARRAAELWADHLAATLHHDVHHDHLGVVDEMATAVHARVSAGRGSLEEVARVEAERARVLRALARFHGDRLRATRVLNALTGRSPDAPLEAEHDAAPEVCALPYDDLVARALARRPLVSAARARTEAAREAVEAARAEATRPEFMVGLSGWFDPNHHDGLGLSASMTLPWLWGGGGSRVTAAEARAAAAQATEREGERAARAEVAEAHARMQSVAAELVVVRADAQAAAARALDAARAGYVTGGVTLLAWLDAARMRLDLAMDEADLRAELERTLAALEEAVGESLPRSPLPAGGAP